MSRATDVETTFAVFAYDDVEPIDIGATYGVLSMAKRLIPGLRMFTVAPEAGTVELASGLRIIADHGFSTCPRADVLIVLGGPGWKEQSEWADTLAFLRAAAKDAVVASVCTGGMILAASGLLDHLEATTRRNAAPGEPIAPLAAMAAAYPLVRTSSNRLVDSGNIITGGGVTLAIDTTLHLIERFYGASVAAQSARLIEYETAWRANENAFA